MRYYIGESGSSGKEFDTLAEFLEEIENRAIVCENLGEEWFEIEVVNG